MRGLQLIAFSLLVLVFLVESQAATRQCNRLNASFLPNCINNSVVKITKSAEMYQVTLLATEWQCFGEFCLVSDLRHQKRNILCNETCRACHQLKPMSGKINDLIHGGKREYRIAGKFGCLAVYIITAKLKSAKISYSHGDSVLNCQI